MIFTTANGSFLFEGVVEDRMDPLKLGRVRVRVFGIHTENKTEIPTDHLFWASVMMPVTAASNSGVGETPALVEGTHVVGYFRDGAASQDPVVIGSLLGIPSEQRKTGVGFNDPRTDLGSVPGGKAYPRWVDEPDTSRLSRNEKATEGTILAKKNSQKVSGIAKPEGTFDQPASPYNAKYPYNKVLETESGHVVEYDDTPGAERVHIAHRSGTFIEMHPDGTIVCRTIGNKFDLVDGTTNEYTKGTHNLTIDATGNVYCKGNYTFKTDGNMKFDVAGNVEWNVQGNFTQEIIGDMTSNAASVKVKGDSTVDITGSSSTTIKGGGTTEQLNSNYNVSTGTFTVGASSISLG